MTPPQIVAEVGENVTFKCKADSSPRWYHGLKEIHNFSYSSDIKNRGFQLHIAYVMQSDDGRYYCTGMFQEKPFVSIGDLIVVGKFVLLKIYTNIMKYKQCKNYWCFVLGRPI